jgi:hypothetical protein
MLTGVRLRAWPIAARDGDDVHAIGTACAGKDEAGIGSVERTPKHHHYSAVAPVMIATASGIE